MKSAAAPAKKTPIRIAVVESDPLRFVGFRALFDSEADFQLISASLPDIGTLQDITERKNIDLELVMLNRVLQMLSASNDALLHATDESELIRLPTKNVRPSAFVISGPRDRTIWHALRFTRCSESRSGKSTVAQSAAGYGETSVYRRCPSNPMWATSTVRNSMSPISSLPGS